VVRHSFPDAAFGKEERSDAYICSNQKSIAEAMFHEGFVFDFRDVARVRHCVLV
jgi:hypothetical protein